MDETARDVYTRACERFPALRGAERGVRVAVNETYVEWDSAIASTDVVAFIPPVAGGRGTGVTVRIGEAPIDPAALQESVRSDEDGAVCMFSGHVRDRTDGQRVTALEYSAYESMAVKIMTALAEGLRAHHGARQIAVAHRIGRLAVGEVTIAIAVAAPHRDAAFATCRDLVDGIKTEAPIFKLEVFDGDTSHWVEGCV